MTQAEAKRIADQAAEVAKVQFTVVLNRRNGEIDRRQEGQGVTRWLSSRTVRFPASRI